MVRKWSVKDLADVLRMDLGDEEVVKNWKVNVGPKTRPFLKEILEKDKIVKSQLKNYGIVEYSGGEQKRGAAYCLDRIRLFLLSKGKRSAIGIRIEICIGAPLKKKESSHYLCWGLFIRGKEYIEKIKENREIAKDFSDDTYGNNPELVYLKGNLTINDLRLMKEDDLVNKIVKDIKDIYNNVWENNIKKKLVEGGNGVPENKLNSILTALRTKPFLILAGVSGTGKTQIARIIAGAVSGEESNEEEK